MLICEPSAELIWITPNSEEIIERAGRTCYKSEDKITKNSAGCFVEKIVNNGHHSVLEHASASFRLITNRYTTHQIVRHRLFSYSQESQRYCDYSKENFNTGVQFVKPVDLSEESEEYQSWLNSMMAAETQYLGLIDNGCAPQVARSVLPSSTKTEIVMTGNFRSWLHFLTLRCSSHAQADVRMLARFIRLRLIIEAPNAFHHLVEEVK